jgi:isoleucyl-tRNA synthetase
MYDPKKSEKEIVEYWKKNNIYKKVRESTKGKKPFYFLQGPPYTSGRIHIGQAWNNSLKDAVLRYKQMQGFQVWDRAGYDMHGLPTASKVQKELNLKTKEDIVKYGLDKFARACMDFSIKHAKMMNEDLFRLGVWLDYENAYMPIDEEWMESVWWLIKRAHEENRLYEGERTLTWCAEHGTALAKHECEYEEITDDSIYVKFKTKGENENLIIWTTTPWTIAFNLAIMVNPEIDYIKAKVDNETWIIAKELADHLIKDILKKDYEILEELKGKELEHIEYEHPFSNEIKDYQKLKKQHPKVHTILLSKEHVNLEAGTGLVHCAPGCGPEDYEVGHDNNIPPYNTVNENGFFPDGIGDFSKLRAKIDDKKFVQKLEENNALITTEKIKHEYAHCERCHNPVIFRKTKQWFFKIEDLKETMLKNNKKVHWVPETVNNAYESWISNLRDNSITKQRFWGTPAPIWRCKKCGDYTVVASKDELSKLSGKTPENLHRPWIDEIKIDCKCGETKERIPDIIDVWIDAGVGSWACLYYPKKKDNFDKLFPADFILEAREQSRLWYSMLTIASTLALGEIPFKNVYSHGMLTDVGGVKMSKSLGNIISPYEVVDKHGADTLRLYITQTNAGEDINFSWEEIAVKQRNITVLWNIYNYLIDYSKAFNVDPTKEVKELELEEKYILSRLNKTIKKATELYEFYEVDSIPGELEKLFLDLSRKYIQYTRDKVNEKPELVLSTIYKVLFELTKMFSTVCPFISESIFLGLKENFKLEKESISLYEWPKHDKKLIKELLEEEVNLADQIIQAGLAAREKAKLGVRWPVQEIKVISRNPAVARTIKSMQSTIGSKLNIKRMVYEKESVDAKIEIQPNRSQIGKDFKQDSKVILKNLSQDLMQEIYKNGATFVSSFSLNQKHIIVKETLPENLTSSDFSQGMVVIDTILTPELETEGFVRELIRRVQDIRKERKLKKQDRINLAIKSDLDISKWKDTLKNKVGATELLLEEKNYPIKEKVNIKSKEFVICVEIN